MIGTPYRDNHHLVTVYAQHLGIAQSLLAQFEALPRRLGEEPYEEVEHQAHVIWEALWTQLTQARDIATSLGRNVTFFDHARKKAGDIWQNVAEVRVGRWEPDLLGKSRIIAWYTKPLGPARLAIAALRGAVPEATITAAPPPDVDLRQHRWLLTYGASVGVAVITALLLWQCAG